MEIVVKLPTPLYSSLQTHLFPQDSSNEQVAFLFVRQDNRPNVISFAPSEHLLVQSDGFEHQSEYHVELSDGMRAGVIKHAHELHASLVEIHSHRFSAPAQFSWSDVLGLKEFVPHIWWRLKGRPYIALVFGPSNFDALVWLTDPRQPIKLTVIDVDGRLLKPTNLSFSRWEDTYEE